MKKILLIITMLVMPLALSAETFEQFTKRLIPGHIIILPEAEGTRIKIGKIDGENIEDIEIYKYDKNNKLKKEVHAKKGTITDKGKGVAMFILSNALINQYADGFTQKSKVSTYEISFMYQPMAKINGKLYKIKRENE